MGCSASPRERCSLECSSSLRDLPALSAQDSPRVLVERSVRAKAVVATRSTLTQKCWRAIPLRRKSLPQASSWALETSSARHKSKVRAGEIEGKRLGIMTFLGAFLVAPGLHMWFGTLARMTAHLQGPKQVAVSLAADQLLWAPPFVTVFMSSVLTLEAIVVIIIIIINHHQSSSSPIPLHYYSRHHHHSPPPPLS